MTNEELLKTRYIIIADWPQSNINPFHVGDILVELSIYFTREKNPKSIHREEIVKYPHLFKKLEWYDERRSEDLPTYIKIEKGDDNFFPRSWGIVFKIKEWRAGFARTEDNNCLDNREFLYKPATEEEYLQYTQKK